MEKMFNYPEELRCGEGLHSCIVPTVLPKYKLMGQNKDVIIYKLKISEQLRPRRMSRTNKHTEVTVGEHLTWLYEM